MSPEMAVEEIREVVGDREDVRLLDVRTPEEWQAARIDGADFLTEDLAEEMRARGWPDAAIGVCGHDGLRSRLVGR